MKNRKSKAQIISSIFAVALLMGIALWVTGYGLSSHMQVTGSAAFSGNFGERASYLPLGVSTWHGSETVEKSAETAADSAYTLGYRKAVLVFGSVFAAFVIIAAIIIASIFRKSKNERELMHRQYDRFQVALLELRSAVFSYDIPSHKVTVSETFEQIFGYKPPEDWAHSYKAEVAAHPEIDFEALRRAQHEVELTGSGTQVVLWAYNKNGELRWFRLIIAPLNYRNGQLNSICGIIIDVTERHDEHQSLRMEQERLTLAVKNLASLVISCNLTQNTFRMINYNVFSSKPVAHEGTFDDLVATGVSFVPEDDRQRFIDAFSREHLLAAYRRGEKTVELEHKRFGDDGVVRWSRTCVLFVDNPFDDDVYEITLSRDITQAKQYQALLQKTFDLTVENMPSFVGKWLFKDGDIFLIYANRRYLEFLGTTEEAAFGKSIFSGLYDDVNDKHAYEKSIILERLYACEKQKKPITSVNRGWKMNGDQYWLKVQASFFEEEGGCSVYYGTVTDITEQITTQQKLAEIVTELSGAYAQVAAANVYRDLMDYSHAGGMSVRTLLNSGEQRFLYASPGLLNAFGYTEKEYMESIVNGHCSFLNPDDLHNIDEANRRLNSLGDAFTLEYRVRHKDGHYLWVIEHAMVTAMPSGDKVVACLTVDVSEQKRLEERLRISRQEYKIAASLANCAVLSYDIATRTYEVISNNNEAHDFARAKNDVPEYAIRIGAVASESAEIVRKIFNAIANGEQLEKKIISLYSRDGDKYWMELSCTILFDDGGMPLTAILAFDDVTAKIQAEELFNISSTFLNYSKNATKLIVVDLTTRTVRYETEGAHGLLSKVAETRNSADAVQYFISRMVVPEDNDECRAFFSASHFLESYKNGITEESFEYRGYTADNIPHWNNAQTRLMEDIYTHDIILYVVISDINEQKLAELELMRRAETDSLTGLLNREGFEAAIRSCCADPESRSCGMFNAIVMIDIDNFKSINDTYGHDKGDESLREVAQRIKENIRSDDIVARFGGDEFIAQLPHMPSLSMIEQRCARICAALNFKPNDSFAVSSSIGIAVCPEDGCDFPTLFKKADLAMYQAKKAGGNRCARYTDDGIHQIVPETDRQAAEGASKRVFARTFGYFDLFIDGAPLRFAAQKEKELLALLIDRNGKPLEVGEAIALLWQNEPCGMEQTDRYCKLAVSLRDTLRKAGVGDIIISDEGVYSIDVKKLTCDYYQFLHGDPEFKKLYNGIYMSNYNWSNPTVQMLDSLV